jgi:hypothetical protein
VVWIFVSHPSFLVHSFKLWVFSWMGLGGVETEEEFDKSYMMLRRWLVSFEDDSPVHRQNAIVLDNFLTSKIMPHKVRFFFAGRQRRMTLNQKATSALENINQTIKVSSGKRVTPNMSMCESLRTMDIQVENVLADRLIVASTKARSRSLWARSSTGDRVTKPCESQIAQQTEQSGLYACSLTEYRKGISRLLFKRLPENPLYCIDCEKMKETDELSYRDCCPVHSATSPIPSYLRIRSVDIISVGEDGLFYEVRCSCLYHPTYGIPCRHIIAVLFQVLPHHVFVRWHTKFYAYYKQEHCDAITEEFDLRKRDLRLIITHEERDAIVRAAEELEALHRNLPAEFWQTKTAVCCHSTNGLVPLDTEDFDHDDDVCTDAFAGGFLSQNIGLSQCQTEDDTALNPKNSLQAMAVQSSDLFASCRSIFTMVCEQAKHSKNPAVESIIRNHLASMQVDVSQEMIRNLDGKKEAFTGEFVSSHVPFDNRTKFKRIRGAGEPRRGRGNAKGVRVPVIFDMGSVIP